MSAIFCRVARQSSTFSLGSRLFLFRGFVIARGWQKCQSSKMQGSIWCRNLKPMELGHNPERRLSWDKQRPSDGLVNLKYWKGRSMLPWARRGCWRIFACQSATLAALPSNRGSHLVLRQRWCSLECMERQTSYFPNHSQTFSDGSIMLVFDFKLFSKQFPVHHPQDGVANTVGIQSVGRRLLFAQWGSPCSLLEKPP